MYDLVSVTGIDLYYQTVGDGSPIVFLHGFSGNHLSWWQQIPAFAADYHCLAPDQRMFGRSTDRPDGPGASAFVDDLAALLDHLHIDRATIVGHSMSGWTAASFTSQFPDRVTALVLSGTPGGLVSPARHETLQVDETDLPTVDPLSPALAFLEDAIAAHNTNAPPTFSDIRPVLENFPIEADRLATVPTFFIAGEADPFMPPPAIHEISDRVQGATATVIEGARHSVNFERPTAFNRHLVEFLRDTAD